MTSCAEWTGVLLSTLLKECGLKSCATWFVAEGADEVKGASSMPIAKAMDDCIIAYRMNGEASRPQLSQRFPLRARSSSFSCQTSICRLTKQRRHPRWLKMLPKKASRGSLASPQSTLRPD
jgi:sulfane dehydrogenase subunit SoxC